ncbi:MAG: N5,N10-methylene tetrahydromethanopterin reductase, partial [Actinomycetota bacterium]
GRRRPRTVPGGAREKLHDAWRAAGREGEPRTMALLYFALGENGERNAREKLGDYYSFLGDYAEQIVQSAAKDDQTVKDYVSALEQAGADELIFFPASADPDQVDLLRRAVFS